MDVTHFIHEYLEQSDPAISKDSIELLVLYDIKLSLLMYKVQNPCPYQKHTKIILHVQSIKLLPHEKCFVFIAKNFAVHRTFQSVPFGSIA